MLRESMFSSTILVDAPGPRLDQTVDFSFKADWGMANLTQVARWLQQECIDRAGPGSRGAIHSGRGGADSIRAVAAGEVDFALTTPAMCARMAYEGVAMFDGHPLSSLRAIGSVPQNDRLLFLAQARTGVRTIAELAARTEPWTLATCPDDGVNFVGYATEQMLTAHGMDANVREQRGVRYLLDERPRRALFGFRDGEVDVIAMEGISIPIWEEIWRVQPDAVVLDPDPAALAELERRLGWPSSPVPEGWWPEREVTGPQLDFSDFLVITDERVPEELVHLISWCLYETRPSLERHYRHLPPERAGVTYPLVPEAMANVPIPLHDGARRYLEEAGIR
jgi:uncharacterized protein